MRIKGTQSMYGAQAAFWLRQARRVSGDGGRARFQVKKCRRCLLRGNLAPVDIGTNSQELQILKRRTRR